MRRSRGKGPNSIIVLSISPAEPALSKRLHRLAASDLSASVRVLVGRHLATSGNQAASPGNQAASPGLVKPESLGRMEWR